MTLEEQELLCTENSEPIRYFRLGIPLSILQDRPYLYSKEEMCEIIKNEFVDEISKYLESKNENKC